MAKKGFQFTGNELDRATFSRFLVQYHIPSSCNPTFTTPGSPACAISNRQVVLYTSHFETNNVRLPFTPFYLSVLDFFRCHVSQLAPSGEIKITCFEVLYRALGFETTVHLFRLFYKLGAAGDWVIVERRPGVEWLGDCDYPDIRSSWKKSYLLTSLSLIQLPIPTYFRRDLLSKVLWTTISRILDMTLPIKSYWSFIPSPIVPCRACIVCSWYLPFLGILS